MYLKPLFFHYKGKNLKVHIVKMLNLLKEDPIINSKYYKQQRGRNIYRSLAHYWPNTFLSCTSEESDLIASSPRSCLSHWIPLPSIESCISFSYVSWCTGVVKSASILSRKSNKKWVKIILTRINGVIYPKNLFNTI